MKAVRVLLLLLVSGIDMCIEGAKESLFDDTREYQREYSLKGRLLWNNLDDKLHPGLSHRQTQQQQQQQQQTQGSPMPATTTTTTTTTTTNTAPNCLSKEDGSYGSIEKGEQISVYFFYQVEAEQGTTESLMNAVILDDVEITLIDFLIPKLFEECGATEHQTNDSLRYLGISSVPADFVLRGFECTLGSLEPCFVISGSINAYTEEGTDDASVVQVDLKREIYRIMSSVEMAATILQVNSISLLNDFLDLATLPPISSTIAPTTPRLTPSPSSFLPTRIPTRRPITSSPSKFPTNRSVSFGPSASPSTVSPTIFPSILPTTLESPILPTASTTDAPISRSPTEISLPLETTATIMITTTTSPSVADGKEPSLTPTIDATSETNPTQPPTQVATINYAYREYESPFEKVPIWAWILICLAVVGCCTYAADPDDDDEDAAGAKENLRDLNEQERLTLANANGQGEEEKEYDGQSKDREAFSSLEYARRLYRQ